MPSQQSGTLGAPASSRQIIRVACIGDSITFGGGVQNREVDSYPAVLGRLLGTGYLTRNFGVSGATVLKKCEMEGDVSYWVTPEFRVVTDFQPHFLIMKFGTNDSKPPTWKYRAEFEGDLNAMLDHFEKLCTGLKIWICIPVPAFVPIGGINEQVLQGEIAPTIRRVAQQRGASVIDLHSVLQDRPDCIPDGIHPNEAGAKLMAEAVCNALDRGRGDSTRTCSDGTVVKCVDHERPPAKRRPEMG